MFKKIFIWFFGSITVLLVCLPLLHATFFRLHDFVHAARIIEIVRGLSDGYFPVRWSENFGYGFGMPLFEFYAPLPYYTGAFFYFLGFNAVTSIKFLYIICSVLTFLGMYKLASRLFGQAGGVLSAVALTMAPYRAVNLYVRGAVSEAWGIMALPWILLGMVQIIRKEKSGWLSLLFGLIVLLLSHNITSLLFIPFSILFGLGYWLIYLLKHSYKQSFIQKIKPIITLGLLYSLGVGLSAFYIFPAFLEKDFTKVNQIFGGYFAYSNHFLYVRQFFTPNWGYGGSVWGPDDGISFFLGYGQIIGLFFVLFWFCKELLRRMKMLILRRNGIQLVTYRPQPFYLPLLCLSLMILSSAMTLLKSKPIWDVLPFMVTVQFPWRWLSVIIIFLALLVGMGSTYIHQRFLRYIYVVVLSLVIISTSFSYFRPESYLKSNDDYYYTDETRIRTQLSAILPDYIPKQMSEEYFFVPTGQVFWKNPEDTEFKVMTDKVQEKVVEVLVSQPTQLEFGIADYPGWTVLIDGQPTTKIVSKIGNIAVKVPVGKHVVSVVFKETPIRQMSDGISIACLALLFGIFALYRNQQRNEHRA